MLASLPTRRSRRWERLWQVLHKPRKGNPLAFEFWLGGALNPYLKGRLRDRILREVKPRDIKLPQGAWYLDGLMDDAETTIVETTVLRSWMKLWLSWVLWYSSVALNPDTRLQDLLDYPVVELSWKRRNANNDIKRFGLTWKVYDWAVKGRSMKPLILAP